METAKPRKLGRGLSALLGEPVAITLPAAGSPSHESTKPQGHEGTGAVAVALAPKAAAKTAPEREAASRAPVAAAQAASRSTVVGGRDLPAAAPVSSRADTSPSEGPDREPGMRVVMVGVEEVVAGVQGDGACMGAGGGGLGRHCGGGAVHQYQPCR